jgi:hypothetical protein
MNEIHLRPRPRTRTGAALAGAALAVTAGVMLLTAACGSPSPGPSSAGSAATPSAGASGSGAQSPLAFSRCMRSHGVPNFPDPPADFHGKFPGSSPQQLGITESRLRTITQSCQNLLPAAPGQAPLTPQEQQDYLRAVACIRAHGFTSFPDPDFSGGHVSFPTPLAGIDTSSPQFIQAVHACQHLIPAGLPDSGSS